MLRNYFFFKIESPLGTVTPARLPEQRAIHLPCPHKAHSSFYFKSLLDPLPNFIHSFGLVVLTSPSYFFLELSVFHLNSPQRTPLFVSKVFPSKPYLFYSFPPTLLPDVHFLEQLWQEPIYYCKIRRNSPGLGSTGEFLRILQ